MGDLYETLYSREALREHSNRKAEIELNKTAPVGGGEIAARAQVQDTIDQVSIAYRDLSSPRSNTSASSGSYFSIEDGEKFPGGLGPTPLLVIDYWSLRARSAELFQKNIYARGAVRRLVTSVVSTGLDVEAAPDPTLTRMPREQISEWSEQVETLMRLWGSIATTCDYLEEQTWKQLQRSIYLEALVSGDVLIILQQDKRTGMPKIRTINGSAVRTPLIDSFGSISGNQTLPNGNSITHGVERDKNKRVVAYHVQKEDPSQPFSIATERIPAFDSNGRRLAWLYFATDKRFDEVRGQPLLALVIQALKEIDRYRDSALRKAWLASLIVAAVTREQGAKGPGTNPLANMGAGFKRANTNADMAEVPTDGETTKLAKLLGIPGVMIDSLADGEKLEMLGGKGTDDKFGEFEGAILHGIALGLSIPPEILRLTFSSNYSASRAAEVNFKQYVDLIRDDIGDSLILPVYREIVLSLALRRKIEADGLLRAQRDPELWAEYAAWTAAELTGAVKPDVDPLKLVRAAEIRVKNAWATNARITRELGGGKFSKNVEQLKEENEQLAEVNPAPPEEDRAPPRDPANEPNNQDTEGPPNEDAMRTRVAELVDDYFMSDEDPVLTLDAIKEAVEA